MYHHSLRCEVKHRKYALHVTCTHVCVHIYTCVYMYMWNQRNRNIYIKTNGFVLNGDQTVIRHWYISNMVAFSWYIWKIIFCIFQNYIENSGPCATSSRQKIDGAFRPQLVRTWSPQSNHLWSTASYQQLFDLRSGFLSTQVFWWDLSPCPADMGIAAHEHPRAEKSAKPQSNCGCTEALRQSVCIPASRSGVICCAGPENSQDISMNACVYVCLSGYAGWWQ